MKPSKHIETLLQAWGDQWMSEYLGCPKRCPYAAEWRPKGTLNKQDFADLLESEGLRLEAERLAEWMPEHLRPLQIHCLRVRYRKNIIYKRKAAKYMKRHGFPMMTEQRYRDNVSEAIEKIEKYF